MELQKVYKHSYVDKLRTSVKKESYLRTKFESDLKQTILLADVYNNAATLSSKMIPDAAHDFESAIALFEAYPDISPILAS